MRLSEWFAAPKLAAAFMPRSWPTTGVTDSDTNTNKTALHILEGRHSFRCIARTRRASSPVRAAGLSRGCASPAIHRAAAVPTVRADVPLQLQQMIATWAWATQLGAARWADLEIALDPVVAGRTRLPLGHLRQE